MNCYMRLHPSIHDVYQCASQPVVRVESDEIISGISTESWINERNFVINKCVSVVNWRHWRRLDDASTCNYWMLFERPAIVLLIAWNNWHTIERYLGDREVIYLCDTFVEAVSDSTTEQCAWKELPVQLSCVAWCATNPIERLAQLYNK